MKIGMLNDIGWKLLGGVSPDDFLMSTSRVFLSGVRTLQDNQYVANHKNM